MGVVIAGVQVCAFKDVQSGEVYENSAIICTPVRETGPIFLRMLSLLTFQSFGSVD